MAPLSITSPSPFRLALARRSGAKGFDRQGDTQSGATAAEVYASNLAKLIPGDIIALYALLKQIDVPPELAGYQLAPFFCVVVLVAVRAWATRTAAGRPRWGLVLLSLTTFICWIYSQHDWFWNWQASGIWLYIANAGLLTLAFIAPIFVGDRS